MIIISKKFGRQNSAYRHLNMKGAFGNEGALRFLSIGKEFLDSLDYFCEWP
jgi:hypothetical protein